MIKNFTFIICSIVILQCKKNTIQSPDPGNLFNSNKSTNSKLPISENAQEIKTEDKSHSGNNNQLEPEMIKDESINSNNSKNLTSKLDKNNKENNSYLDLIHTGTFEKKLEENIDYDPKKLDFDGYELLEYDPPRDLNCWVWAFIPIFLSQVLSDDKKYNDFVNKVKALPEFLNKKIYGLKLTEEEKDICSKALVILQKLKNKEGNLKELDNDQIIVKFIRKISNLLLDSWLIVEWYGELYYIKKNLLKNPNSINLIETYMTNALIQNRLFIKDMGFALNELETIIDSMENLTEDQYIDIKVRFLKIADEIEIAEELRNLKNSCGSPKDLRYFLSYFNILLLNIHSESIWYGIKNGILLGDPGLESPKESFKQYINENDFPNIFMRYVNKNHYRYVVLNKK